MNTVLSIDNLKVSVEDTIILDGFSLTINQGEVHAIMGPNGSGKSTLTKAIAGHPDYHVQAGSITYNGQDLLAMPVHERANAGIFLSFQHPIEIPGLSNLELLKIAVECQCKARNEPPPTPTELLKQIRSHAKTLGLDMDHLKRGINDGFSGGEKKRNEMLQMLLLSPQLALLDETDSGLDIDALKVVSAAINSTRNARNSILMITHYQRLLNYVTPDHVHVMCDGKIIRSGDASFAQELEAKGYDWLIDKTEI